MAFGYFAFVLGWSWSFWSVPVVLGGDPWAMPNVAFIYAGGAGPLLGGLVFTYARGGRYGLRDLGARLTGVRRIGTMWWLVVLGLIPLIEAAAALIAGKVSAAPPMVFAPLLRNLADPAAFLALAGFTLLLGPLPEEIGWRGFALDALQARFAPILASLILAAGWGAWHAPLFLMDGYYAPFGGPPPPVQFAYDILLTTLLMTWIFNHTGRSVLAAVLFHFMGNFSEEIVVPSDSGDMIATILTTLVVAVVMASGGLRRPALA
ncbi:CPBP family intramembrane glutamic endopeptidase [Dichotomicrobium thermohalophilum]|uniref:CAAX prenyl protease-like protein n=1 Tax=Dichotomicrobium thermohalophilum TaxID=933063 RepID=A0A397Q611_9HYPH|nr:CPBP family intramembrane glutamic endopeptidase [Dichotomicrobium thermohalophilum]RIA55245.1 CAAX prenyl protease-like protein [Dichotomicrobium thermohalophilum]